MGIFGLAAGQTAELERFMVGRNLRGTVGDAVEDIVVGAVRN